MPTSTCMAGYMEAQHPQRAFGKGSSVTSWLQSEEDNDANMAREGGGASLAPQVAPGEHYGDSSSSSKEKRPTGRVVGVIRRNWRTRGYSGSLQPDRLGRPTKQGASSVLFCPVERRYPFIRIQTRQVLLTGHPLLERSLNCRTHLDYL